MLSISARHSPALPTTFRPALLLPDPIFHRKKRDLTIRTQPACKVPSGRCLSLCYQDKKYYIYFKQNWSDSDFQVSRVHEIIKAVTQLLCALDSFWILVFLLVYRIFVPEISNRVHKVGWSHRNEMCFSCDPKLTHVLFHCNCILNWVLKNMTPTRVVRFHILAFC